MPQIPFAFQCTFQENELLALKESKNGSLDTVPVSRIPNFKYGLSVLPNGFDDASRGEVWIGIYLQLGNLKKVEGDISVIIESANYSDKDQYIYEDSTGWAYSICKTEDFFQPETKFIVDGKCIIKVYGTFKFEDENTISEIAVSNQQKWDGGELGNALWEDDGDKEFTIFVDGKEIKVHKLLLGTRSDVFKAMFNPETKESIEKKVEIPDFSFNVVEIAVKLIYTCGFTSFLSLDELMSLLQFFDKYNIQSLKEKVESFLIDQISASTVCRLTNASMFTNSFQLKNKCMKFLEKSFTLNTPLNDFEILENVVLVEVVQNMSYSYIRLR